MSRTSSKRDATHRHSNEGTAARTRPMSFEEIMSRRKKNVDSDVKERASGLIESSEKDEFNGAITDGGSKSERDFDGAAKSNLNRLDIKDKVRDHLKRLEEKDVKGNSKSHEEKYPEKGNSKMSEGVSKAEKERFERKDKRNRDSEVSTKLGASYGKSSRDREGQTEKERHHKSRSHNHSGADAEKVRELKQIKGSSEKAKHEELDGKHGKVGKRKHESYVDDKKRSAVDGSSLKKHDAGKLRDTEYSERKDRKKEHFQAHQQPSFKRRRSRSREYHRERDRSVSASPRAHRRSYHGREYDEPPNQSFKDSSRRKYSETDKYRASGNGGYGSGQYRKHGSGLGGYSPRKRRTETAAKSPSPSKHKSPSPSKHPSPSKRSPERKSSTWDQPPAGASHAGSTMLASSQAPSSKTFESTSSNTVIQAATKVQPVPSFDSAPMFFSASIDSVQLTQATRPRRQLYIENLPPSASDKSVIDCLNDFLLSSGVNHIRGAKPCISCIINKDKCQAVVEFLTPEDATSAVSFDGRSLLGSVLKIRRPKDFMGAPSGGVLKKALPEETVPMVKTLSEIVNDSPNKIFIGGISKALTSDMLLEVVSAFGVLRAFRFEFNEELNGPCAFIEYEDHSFTRKACAGLNGMKLGGQVLTAAVAFVDFRGKEDGDEDLPTYDVPLHAKSLLEDSTRVLQLKNVFNPEEFLSLTESELEETLEDIRLECTRFGTVKSINVVKFSGTCEHASEALERQDSQDEPSIIGTRSPISNCDGGDANVKELDDATDHTQNANMSREGQVEDCEREEESVNPCTTTIDGVIPRSEDISSPAKELDVNNVEESLDLKAEMLTEVSSVGVDITVGEFDESNSHPIGGGSEQIPSQDIKLETSAADFVTGDGDHWTPDLSVFEPGSVLVEFLREAAACNAAHCLHQRSYAERIVTVGYVSHDLYIEHFPR